MLLQFDTELQHY